MRSSGPDMHDRPGSSAVRRGASVLRPARHDLGVGEAGLPEADAVTELHELASFAKMRRRRSYARGDLLDTASSTPALVMARVSPIGLPLRVCPNSWLARGRMVARSVTSGSFARAIGSRRPRRRGRDHLGDHQADAVGRDVEAVEQARKRRDARTLGIDRSVSSRMWSESSKAARRRSRDGARGVDDGVTELRAAGAGARASPRRARRSRLSICCGRQDGRARSHDGEGAWRKSRRRRSCRGDAGITRRAQIEERRDIAPLQVEVARATDPEVSAAIWTARLTAVVVAPRLRARRRS